MEILQSHLTFPGSTSRAGSSVLDFPRFETWLSANICHFYAMLSIVQTNANNASIAFSTWIERAGNEMDR